ncbi:MAG: hypothetical protein NZ821_09300 [Gloeomargarita sp. SKYB31]|nr:hypothetical protein [Gloeomargarita sp. SKYB31]
MARGWGLGLGLLMGLSLFPAYAQPQRVQFPAGASSTTLQATVRGYQVAEYVLRARAGQVMSVQVVSANPHVVFSMFDQEGRHFPGSPAETTQWRGRLPSSGDYVIVAGLTRAAARRTSQPVRLTLHVTIR